MISSAVNPCDDAPHPHKALSEAHSTLGRRRSSAA
ncbi:hypothetical protein EIB18_03640 [Caulobacter vibrioides]|uniref:Uncharacterized protein n=1 Tax=Caulobacter vibrioides (strain NA1000 / CB15N) TaxID=565050 RepID=A0A0H3IWC0_CAUVN|nr:hypothetical protein [Caulobacter vibrioides]YP_009020502.1 hypothetical protein CCNA_03930 [Caulobacter vibrioides NA1000]AHI88533.1 hypothetical protein CCNA_03930 [Caulobacter vibrioides NA1000]AVH77061.1 hypothetical protein CA607_20265 [Caulobacter vibrioides]AZH11896.1 hypothetical protein EIB18_03640 [Caulobacter vibrioides]QXZ52762.1 hypothetical protein KZH45_03530 [Caulobacter vibrioides]